MLEFFSMTNGVFHFHLFGFDHFLLSALTLFCVFLFYKYANVIRSWKYHDSFIRYSIAFIMFINMSIYYGCKIIDGSYNLRYHLPLHFCFISGYLFMYLLLTNNQNLYRYVYFFAFAGPLPAMIFPDLTCGMDRFLFWQFIISHHFFLIANLYVLFVLRWNINYNDAFCAFKGANIIFISVFIFNMIFHTNYIMTTTLPKHILKIFPFLTMINIPILWLELAGISACIIALIPIYILKRKQKLKNA